MKYIYVIELIMSRISIEGCNNNGFNYNPYGKAGWRHYWEEKDQYESFFWKVIWREIDDEDVLSGVKWRLSENGWFASWWTKKIRRELERQSFCYCH